MSKSGYVLAVDQGTTGTTAGLVDHSGSLLWTSYQKIHQYFPQPGWVEHDPFELLDSVFSTIDMLLDDYEVSPDELTAFGITNQRETTVIWNKHTGKPIYNAIGWQCRRTTHICSQLRINGFEDLINNITGLPLHPYFSATKIRWLLDKDPEIQRKAEQGDLLFGTVDSWILWNMTNGKTHATDASNASRTMLFDIQTLAWSDEILELLNIPICMLPEVKPSSGLFSYASGNHFAGRSIPISGIAGDQHSSLFGQRCFHPGMVKCTYGTGAFLLLNTGTRIIRSDNGLIPTVAWQTEDHTIYALEGGVFSAGATVQWLSEALQIIDDPSDIEILARSVDDNGGVYMVPAFTGLGAPYWDPRARGSIFGLTLGSTRGHLARAALESTAFQCRDIVEAMSNALQKPISLLRVDGGASENQMMLQFQTNIINLPVEKSDTAESTVLGAAFLAGLAIGFWDSERCLENIRTSSQSYYPNMGAKERTSLIRYWKKAVKRTSHWQMPDQPHGVTKCPY